MEVSQTSIFGVISYYFRTFNMKDPVYNTRITTCIYPRIQTGYYGELWARQICININAGSRQDGGVFSWLSHKEHFTEGE